MKSPRGSDTMAQRCRRLPRIAPAVCAGGDFPVRASIRPDDF
ncbi:hypothetical protein [Burkholderia gladioli]|nr:hypothetical protein [Burkholderia gladioli]